MSRSARVNLLINVLFDFSLAQCTSDLWELHKELENLLMTIRISKRALIALAVLVVVLVVFICYHYTLD